jgi:ADP-dependent NAD(P)H-hydrate dehydratase / NAD(P)H-hydrate epimerase
MRRIALNIFEPLHGANSTRAIEQQAAKNLPPHTLMALAGWAVARLTQALAPHAQNIWVACGPGNNGGDGLVAATHLFNDAQANGLSRSVFVTLAGDAEKLPEDAAHALQLALAAGVHIGDEPPLAFDFAIDALLGIGATREPSGVLAHHLARLRSSASPVLCVDLPSGLLSDSGLLLPTPQEEHTGCGPRFTLSLLTLKPGLFTAQGRDAAGEIWFDDLSTTGSTQEPPTALLAGCADQPLSSPRNHAAHKGSQGEVLVIGGQGLGSAGVGMTGAAVLAARAALRMGAGRVYLSLLDRSGATAHWDPLQPELMVRSPQAAMSSDLLERSAVVCGCGGGEAIKELLIPVLSRARTLVLDADALNGIATDTQWQTLLQQRQAKGFTTVITPHPLEAARLLGTTTARVMADRLAAARQLSEKFGVICVLKGSGTVMHAPGEMPLINPSGNGALATAGTGDVLAGMLGAALATQPHHQSPLLRTAQAVFEHGRLADKWVAQHGTHALCADQLTQV